MSGPEYTSLPATDIDNISGDIFVPTAQEDSNTLDEPISATLVKFICRDHMFLPFCVLRTCVQSTQSLQSEIHRRYQSCIAKLTLYSADARCESGGQ